MAVVACGLYLGRKSVHFRSPGVRIQATAVWQALTFILNGVVFVPIGVQLPAVLAGIRGYDVSTACESTSPNTLLEMPRSAAARSPEARTVHRTRSADFAAARHRR
jgi:hypothetical protein